MIGSIVLAIAAVTATAASGLAACRGQLLLSGIAAGIAVGALIQLGWWAW